ncbi:hypothetical protein [Apilactobacillus quenuiae]|uniref:hypothetical protein n=1 Tax=Apilactobacillus quenuiae TaxID=2008377 RepID=UPI000D017E28|nr:hypothetical protein [Apilactobacillus quenuiae]
MSLIFFLMLIGSFIYIIYLSTKRKKNLEQIADSLSSEDRSRWNFYTKSRKIATISNVSLGIFMGMSISIIIVAFLYSLKIYVICWILFFIILAFQFATVFAKRLLQNYNDFIGINLDLFNKNTKSFKIIQYVIIVLFDILLMSFCYAIYLFYK